MVVRHVITGAPGSGKTAVLSELAEGAVIVGEPARELIAEHRSHTGERSLDHVPEVFVELLIRRSLAKFDTPIRAPLAFYDRGLPDCVAYAEILGVDPGPAVMAARSRRYDDPVFIFPPWESIYTTDDMRRMRFSDAQPFHDLLVAAYESLDYRVVEVPRLAIDERAAFIARGVGLR